MSCLQSLTLSFQVVHPIHDQSFYLTSEHKRKIKEEFGKDEEKKCKNAFVIPMHNYLHNCFTLEGVEPWTFEQRLGEAVFIPAGCPHQVRNLKVINS